MISQSSFLTKAICHSFRPFFSAKWVKWPVLSGLLWIEHFWLEHDQLNVPEFTLGMIDGYSKLLNIISNDFQNHSWRIKKISCLILFGNVIQYDAANEFDSESVLNKIRILPSKNFGISPKLLADMELTFMSNLTVGPHTRDKISILARKAKKPSMCSQFSFIYIKMTKSKFYFRYHSIILPVYFCSNLRRTRLYVRRILKRSVPNC